MAEVRLTTEEYNELKEKADNWDSKKAKIKEVPREFKHEFVVTNMRWNGCTSFKTNNKVVLALVEELDKCNSMYKSLRHDNDYIEMKRSDYKEAILHKLYVLSNIGLFKRVFCFRKSINKIFNNG